MSSNDFHQGAEVTRSKPIPVSICRLGSSVKRPSSPRKNCMKTRFLQFLQKNIIRIFQIISWKKNKKLKLPGPRGETWTSKKLHHTFNTTAADCTGERGARSRWHLDRLHSPMLKHHARRFDHSAILSTVHTGLCIKKHHKEAKPTQKDLEPLASLIIYYIIIASC